MSKKGETEKAVAEPKETIVPSLKSMVVAASRLAGPKTTAVSTMLLKTTLKPFHAFCLIFLAGFPRRFSGKDVLLSPLPGISPRILKIAVELINQS